MKNSIFLLVFLFLSSSINIYAQWVQVNNGMGARWILSLTTSGNDIFVGTSHPAAGIFLSTNNGTSWTQTSLNNRNVFSIAVNGNNIYAGTVQYGIYLSTNYGTSWAQTSVNNDDIYSFALNGNNIVAGSVFVVYYSTNNGATWGQASGFNSSVYGLAFMGSNLFAGTSNLGYGVFLSTNNGFNWTQTSFNNQYVWCLKVAGNNLFAGTQNNGVFMSTNNGVNWSQTSLNGRTVWSLEVNGNNIFAGTDVGVYVSNDNGTTWTLRNEGFGNFPYVNALCILNNYVFAGTGNNNYTGVWRRPLSEVIGIKPISNEVPNQFSLSQNFPNPFNPSTKIKFSVPASLSFGEGPRVRLIIYDILGREVTTLINEPLSPGSYEIEWDAANYTSGIYYYKLETEAFSQTRKMVLMK